MTAFAILGGQVGYTVDTLINVDGGRWFEAHK